MKKLTTEGFINKAKKIHGDKYDYSKVEYVNAKTKVCIICPEHGEFWQTPDNHLKGFGCTKCNSFIKKIKEVHNDKYNYSKVNYVDSKTKVCIICPKHGEFWQTPNAHLQGQGCPKCSIEYNKKRMSLTTEEFIKKAKEIHGDKYDYSKTDYINADTKVCIVCKKHGEFWQKPYKHLQGQGCPKCKCSKLESDILNYLINKNINYIHQYRPKFLSEGKRHLSLDFYLPDYNVAIECQGIQHFCQTTFFEKREQNISDRDIKKYNICKDNGIKIYYFSYVVPLSYIDKVYIDKDLLINDIKYEK